MFTVRLDLGGFGGAEPGLGFSPTLLGTNAQIPRAMSETVVGYLSPASG